MDLPKAILQPNGKNTAYAKVTEKVKDEHSSEPTIYYGIPNLNKNGNYDAENNKVNWTIEVNNNFASLEGYEVSDILLQNDIQQNADIYSKGYDSENWMAGC